MTKFEVFPGYTVIAYQDSDLKDNIDIIEQAKNRWISLCSDYMRKNGDIGFCVLGAGIVINYLGDQCKTVKDKMIIPVNSLKTGQGNCVWEDSVDEIISFLKENGIESRYYPGFID